MRVLLSVLSVLVLACNGGPVDPGPDDGDGDGDGDGDRFAAVTGELEASLPSAPAGVDGMTLIIVDDSGDRVYEHTVGDFDPDRRVGIASASKMVSGLALLRLIEAGDLALTDTTADLLGWSDTAGTITLDHLGAFVSGLRPTFLCAYSGLSTLEACVNTIGNAAMNAAPEAELAYGNSHLHVAARMAEVATGSSWQQIADDVLFAPLGISDPALEYAGGDNPLVAGGLQATANELVEIVALLYHRGRRGADVLIAESLIERMTENRYPGATVASSPYANEGYEFRYGFSSWLECPAAAASCDVVSSAGAFGMTPWVDYENGYYAVLAMKADGSDGSVFSVELQQRLQPMIIDALAD